MCVAISSIHKKYSAASVSTQWDTMKSKNESMQELNKQHGCDLYNQHDHVLGSKNELVYQPHNWHDAPRRGGNDTNQHNAIGRDVWVIADPPLWKLPIYDRPMFLLFRGSDKCTFVQEMKHRSPAGTDPLRSQPVAPTAGA